MVTTLLKFARRWRWRLLTKVRPLGLGVRVIVTCADKVLLVRHSYQTGWYLPGGGVEVGETLAEAAARELKEECDVSSLQPMRFIDMFFSEQQGFSDHIALFHVEVSSHYLRIDGLEIAEAGFFPFDMFPVGATPATRRRLLEFQSGSSRPPRW